MKINDIIAKFNALRENEISTEHKTEIVKALDRRVCNELIDTHYQNSDDERAEGEAVIPDEYFMCYIYWLSHMIDFEVGEIDRSVNEQAMFEAEYDRFVRYYHATHTPKGVREIII